ncbi:hypothetical protein TKK_0009506 [Trichogramma kaykai]
MSEVKKSVVTCLLQSATYPLNPSGSKTATVGLEFRDGEYKPVVQISAELGLDKGIILDRNAWVMLREQISKMLMYSYGLIQSNGDSNEPKRIEENGYSIDFIVMYDTKSVKISRKIFEPMPAEYKKWLEYNVCDDVKFTPTTSTDVQGAQTIFKDSIPQSLQSQTIKRK